MEIKKLIINGDYKKLSKLLQKSEIDLNESDEKGWTPLLLACENEEFDIVRFLVENGADVNKPDFHGQTPLHFAVDEAIDSSCRHELGRRVDDTPVDIIVYLLWKGADPLQKDLNGETPIDWANRYSVNKIVDLLKRYIRNE